MDADEFDAYYDIELDVAHLPYIADLPPSPETTPTVAATVVDNEAAIIPQVLPTRPSSPVSDGFGDYDFSEFTAEDLDAFDPPARGAVHAPTRVLDSGLRKDTPKMCAIAQAPQEDVRHARGASGSSRTQPGYVSGGPAINIELEQSVASECANGEDVVPVLVQPIDSETTMSKKDGKKPARDIEPPPPPSVVRELSLFEMFRSRTAVLAVTDLVSPTW